MGIVNGKTIDLEENFMKNQEFIQNLNKIKMERQIHLQDQMRQRALAMEIASNRELSLWLTTFSILSSIALFTGFRRTKRSYLLAPMLPLTFTTLYFLDLGYGNKIHRIKLEAEHILTHHQEMLEVPCGLPSPSSIDLARLEDEDRKFLHPPPQM